MRFKEYLLENEDDSIESEFLESIYKKIAKNCKQFLNESHDLPVYRGLNTYGTLGTKSTAKYILTPTNRSSKDSTIELSFLLNTIIDKKFNIPNIRNRCFFGTGDFDIANDYGPIFVVFPTDGYKFVWSDKITDPYSVDYEIYAKFADELKKNGFNSIARNGVEKLLGISEYVDSDMFVKDPLSIIDKPFTKECFEQYLTNTNLKSVFKIFTKTIFKLVDVLEYSNINLVKAIQRENEIMFTGCEGYYAVPIERKGYPELLEKIKKYL